MTRRRPGKHAGRGRRVVGWRPNFDGPDVDVAAAIEILLAGLDGRNMLDHVDPRRHYAVVAGFLVLTAELGELLDGDHATFRDRLVAIQLRERADELAAGMDEVALLAAMDGVEATGPPP